VTGVQTCALPIWPEFDGHKVDFDELIRRQQAYVEQERQAMEIYRHRQDGECLLDARLQNLKAAE